MDHTLVVASLAVVVAGCAIETEVPESSWGEQASASSIDNGQNLNGQNLNGQNLNGQNLNGQNLNGQNLNGPGNGTFTIWTSLVGVRLTGTMDTTSLSGTVFTATKNSTVRTGVDVVGAELDAMRGDGRMTAVRIRDVLPPAPGSQIWRYVVDYREDDGSWWALCKDANGPRAAIPLEGTWDHRQGVTGGGGHTADPSHFTFACEGQGALAKCVAMGYEPWRTVSDVGLSAHHESCVRMLRGDFCGDGTPYTQNGSLVNVYDALGIQLDTETWVFEAEWDPAGARCFSPLNRSKLHVPCYEGKLRNDCGDPAHFSTGAVVMTETPTGGTL